MIRRQVDAIRMVKIAAFFRLNLIIFSRVCFGIGSDISKRVISQQIRIKRLIEATDKSPLGMNGKSARWTAQPVLPLANRSDFFIPRIHVSQDVSFAGHSGLLVKPTLPRR